MYKTLLGFVFFLSKISINNFFISQMNSSLGFVFFQSISFMEKSIEKVPGKKNCLQY